jgi:putative tryptophan/tyrosine transport system substrate-binding protein
MSIGPRLIFTFILNIALALFALSPSASAQQTEKVARVGYVVFGPDTSTRPRPAAIEGFRSGLRDRGWIEGKNLTLDVHGGDRRDAGDIAKALMARRTDVIMTDGAMVSGLRSVVGSTPIVFTMSGDPVEANWVESLARPGGNLTGMSTLQVELEGKRLELLKQVRPGLTRVAVLANDRHPGYQSQLKAAQSAAQSLGLTLLVAPVRTAQDFDQAFSAMTKARSEAILVFSDSLVNLPPNPKRIAEFVSQGRLISISSWTSFVEAGNLLSYGPSEHDFSRRAAAYVDKILRGAKPGDLPIEFPSRVELTVSRNTAKSLGITLPQAVLVRADHVVD